MKHFLVKSALHFSLFAGNASITTFYYLFFIDFLNGGGFAFLRLEIKKAT
jgi:hypothetical protein